jgi:hypothetical protein
MGIKSLHNDVVIISPEIDQHLINEKYICGKFDDCYSGADGPCLFYKRLGFDDHSDSYTIVVTDTQIAIEREYPYGGGDSAGKWRFDKESFEDFSNAYNEFVDAVAGLVKERGLQLI